MHVLIGRLAKGLIYTGAKSSHIISRFSRHAHLALQTSKKAEEVVVKGSVVATKSIKLNCVIVLMMMLSSL